MSILDDIKSRLPFTRDYGREEEEYYDEEEVADEPTYRPSSDSYNDSYGESTREEQHSMGVLGQTHRGEAESVAVYTRSGKPVSTRPQGRPGSDPASGSMSSYDLGSQPTADISVAGSGRYSSAQLPAYVLRPVSYDDVQTVVQRVRTNQPVVISFRGTNTDTAKRILDFCFGFSCGVGGSVVEVGDRSFAVLPSGVKLSPAELDKLAADGDLVR